MLRAGRQTRSKALGERCFVVPTLRRICLPITIVRATPSAVDLRTIRTPHLVGSGDDSFPRAGGGVAAMGVPSAVATVGPKVK